MPRYIVVEVDDNKRAEKLIRKLGSLIGIKVLGLYHKPSRFCECPPPEDTWDRQNPRSVRGPKLGLWVHDQCGRPRSGGQHMPRNLLRGREGIVDNHPTLLVWESKDGSGPS